MGTRGLVVKFNRDGVPRLQEEYPTLFRHFASVASNSSNAFVMNILIVPPSNGEKTAQVARHVDDTVGITGWQDFIAHSVSVFYVTLPDSFSGGKLLLYGNSKDNMQPLDVIIPEENLLIAFRGDSFHSVEAFYSDSNTKRVSLVLEQYNIPKSYYHKTTKYEVIEGKSESYDNVYNFLKNFIRYGCVLLAIAEMCKRFLNKK